MEEPEASTLNDSLSSQERIDTVQIDQIVILLIHLLIETDSDLVRRVNVVRFIVKRKERDTRRREYTSAAG